MGGDNDDGSPKRSAIPLIAGAIVTAQITMAAATLAGDKLTLAGVGRKPLFMAGLLTLPIRCALIIWWKDAGDAWLLSTQVLDGIGGGMCGLIHPYLVADITFGTGRFNVVSKSFITHRRVSFQFLLCFLSKYYSFFVPLTSVVIPNLLFSDSIRHFSLTVGLTASFFGLGATLSNFLGQIVVERFGHVASLCGSLVISLAPILLFSAMPETFGRRGDDSLHPGHHLHEQQKRQRRSEEVDTTAAAPYKAMVA